MVDFLRSNPWCSREEYLWKMTVGQVRLASFDFTHVEYKTGKEGKKAQKVSSVKDFNSLSDIGIPTIK